jgi:D-alanine-D-alanine ligase
MSDLGRVLVLAGGLSFEREVSLRSGRRVCDALRAVGVEATVVDADAGLLPRLAEDRPAAVFVALHGATGEDGAIRDVLDLLEIPYVGSSGPACRLAFDKPAAKQLVADAGVATPAYVALPHSTFRELGAAAVLDRMVSRLGLPLMVKPTRGGSSLGATVVRSAEELPAAMMTCFSYGEVALVEQYVAGDELAISVVDTGEGPVVLPAVEIRPVDGPFDYAARYTPGMTEYSTPADLDPAVLEAAGLAALAAHRSLGLRDISRTDLMVANGTPYFLEVNVSPGMTDTSLLPMAAEAAGIDLGALCRDLLAQAAAR